MAEVNALVAPNLPYAPALVEQLKKAVNLYYEGLKRFNWGIVSRDAAIADAALKDISSASIVFGSACSEFSVEFGSTYSACSFTAGFSSGRADILLPIDQPKNTRTQENKNTRTRKTRALLFLLSPENKFLNLINLNELLLIKAPGNW